MSEVARLQRDLHRARARYESALAEIEARNGVGTASNGQPRGGTEPAASALTTTADAGEGDDAKGAGVISLATASFEALRGLGLSVTQATRVLDYRARGELQTVEDLDGVPGIPEAKLRHVKDRLHAEGAAVAAARAPVPDTPRVARIMGIANVTPDSFSDGGLYLDAERAVEHGVALAREGAEIVDVGGESTRPGAAAVPADEELERTEPVVAGLRAAGVAVSIDTSKAKVAQAALDAGARMVNDVTALGADPDLAGLCADRGCEVVLMHMQGTPRTMQQDPTYDDVVDDVRAVLAERIEVATDAGIAEERIWVDPGIGFGKTLAHNLELLRRLGELSDLGRPIVVGTSRKSFIGKLTGRGVQDRLGGTIASNLLAIRAGAEMVRVHDVREMREAAAVATAILDPQHAWGSA